MNITSIRMYLARIENIKHDDEIAHSIEDELREKFIKFVAKTGPKKLKEMANEVLKSDDIKFDRSCA